MSPDGSSPEQAIPLREVSTKIGAWINRLGTIWVSGQIVEVSRSRGWVYLTLRDPNADMSMQVTASSQIFDSAGPLPEGSTVAVLSKPQWWTGKGRLSLQAQEIKPFGEGQLLAQLEQRKRMLQSEGLFAPERKKKLPFLPRKIGLITAAGSDAERDFYRHVQLRWPAALIETAPVTVQGTRCVNDVMQALHRLDIRDDIDVIVVTRGGGSMEDLLPFSDEELVRTVAACRTPIVSAIGHEADNPLLDFVADLRASTPTDAAKRVVPDVAELSQQLSYDLSALRRALMNTVAQEQRDLDALRSRPVLQNPVSALDAHATLLTQLTARLHRAGMTALQHERQNIENARSRIEAMSPKNTLARGYSILIDDIGETVTSAAQLEPGQILEAWLADGQLELIVEDIQLKEQK
ncbi:MAG: exodeoxyribonuclease VII large subunit [Propionibacteriaceae bacterium]